MDDQGFADRLVSYSDAMAAVAFLGVSGLGVALGDPDVRCSLASAFVPIALSNLVSGVVMTVVILTLRRWELQLREGRPLGERAAAISRKLHVARIVVVWTSVLLAIFALYGALGDQSCVR